jgi:hypothetical protein
MDALDLKTRQFAQVLSAMPSEAPVIIQCRRFLEIVSSSSLLRAAMVALSSAFLALLIRPPFIMSFEHDRTRPWKGRSYVSWLSVLMVILIMGAASFLVPLIC